MVRIVLLLLRVQVAAAVLLGQRQEMAGMVEHRVAEAAGEGHLTLLPGEKQATVVLAVAVKFGLYLMKPHHK